MATRLCRAIVARVVVGLAACLLGIGAILLAVVTRPMRLGAAPGSVTARLTHLPDGRTAVLVTSAPMNHPGQIQGVGVRFDAPKQTYLVEMYAVLWHPLSQVATRSNWPVLIDVSDMPPGRFRVVYWTSSGRYDPCLTFELPAPR